MLGAAEMVLARQRIEIIPVKILDEQRALVEELKGLRRALGIEIGWHYLLDLSWIISNLGTPIRGRRFLDAGAGLGLMQCYLAGHGGEVLSVDRQRRSAYVPLSFRTRYHVLGQRPGDVLTGGDLLRARMDQAVGPMRKLTALSRALAGSFWNRLPHHRQGMLFFYEQDLGHLKDVPDSSVDAIVAVSALEHNPADTLQAVVDELMRVLKPGGRLLATLGAARERDWFHEPSQGWNYSEGSLRSAFRLDDNAPSNYADYDELFASLKDCAELRDNLSPLYSNSGNNGMPWGKWDPQYQPVGVLKVNRAS